jgi:endonuclease/exonuclease/phosphatase family metal-dependent hydrolase
MNCFFRYLPVLLIILFFFPKPVLSQEEKSYRIGCIAFYNLENLFDTINDPIINDEEFLPEGRYSWTGERYRIKLERLSEVISQIGTELIPEGPAVIGVSEVENITVLEDLVRTEALRGRNYQIVLYNSPDLRGVDVALLYQPDNFRLFHSQSHRLTIPDQPGYLTRDQLVVSGAFDGDTLYFIVNHWPSRRSGQKETQKYRFAAADLSRSIVDSILVLSPQAKIILMGDLNDNPTDKSIVHRLGCSDNKDPGTDKLMYNPMTDLYKKGIGTIAWRDTWSLFDQMIVSYSLTGDDLSSYRLYTVKVFNKKFLTQHEGAFMGYPFRTYGGGVYLGGYSDHFPVYMFIYREIGSTP